MLRNNVRINNSSTEVPEYEKSARIIIIHRIPFLVTKSQGKGRAFQGNVREYCIKFVQERKRKKKENIPLRNKYSFPSGLEFLWGQGP